MTNSGQRAKPRAINDWEPGSSAKYSCAPFVELVVVVLDEERQVQFLDNWSPKSLPEFSSRRSFSHNAASTLCRVSKSSSSFVALPLLATTIAMVRARAAARPCWLVGWWVRRLPRACPEADGSGPESYSCRYHGSPTAYTVSTATGDLDGGNC